MKTSEREGEEPPMNARETADAVDHGLEAATPVYDVSERGCSLCVSLVDGRRFVVDAPLEGELAAEPRVRDDAGGRAR